MAVLLFDKWSLHITLNDWRVTICVLSVWDLPHHSQATHLTIKWAIILHHSVCLCWRNKWNHLQIQVIHLNFLTNWCLVYHFHIHHQTIFLSLHMLINHHIQWNLFNHVRDTTSDILHSDLIVVSSSSVWILIECFPCFITKMVLKAVLTWLWVSIKMSVGWILIVLIDFLLESVLMWSSDLTWEHILSERLLIRDRQRCTCAFS